MPQQELIISVIDIMIHNSPVCVIEKKKEQSASCMAFVQIRNILGKNSCSTFVVI
jgi:hypothetical protein